MSAVTHPLPFSQRGPIPAADDLLLVCSRCREAVGHISRSHAANEGVLVCPGCHFEIKTRAGVWNALLPERESKFSSFIADYERIRAAEGRGSADARFYLELPERDVTGKNRMQWRIRRGTYECLEHRVIRPQSTRMGRPLDVLDLGAGNGWLSYRLALGGHRPVAVDVLDNDFDGLGAVRHFLSRLPELFPTVRAEFESLPFQDGQFDLAIFNASFHYSESYEKTLGEALRCLRRPGRIVIADTAWYSRHESGEAMVRERSALFLKHFGTSSDALHALEFLTDDRLQHLSACFHLDWHSLQPRYGLRWRMRPIISKLLGRREPSKFRIYTAEVSR